MSDPSALFPAPPENPDVIPFLDAAAEGRFIGRHCAGCNRHHWYPRPFCPYCSGSTDWVPLSGDGTVYSYAVMRRVPEPYAIAYVRLSEGPAMLTHIVQCDLDDIAIGMPVRVVFKPAEGGRMLACFRPDRGMG